MGDEGREGVLGRVLWGVTVAEAVLESVEVLGMLVVLVVKVCDRALGRVVSRISSSRQLLADYTSHGKGEFTSSWSLRRLGIGLIRIPIYVLCIVQIVVPFCGRVVSV